MPPPPDQAWVPTSRLIAAHQAAANFYRVQLNADRAVQAYLDRRGLNHAAPWQLGYAPTGWRTLTTYLRGAGFDEEELLASGLATRARTGELIDRFRDRLVLPLRRDDGSIVAFTGRPPHDRIPQTVPKYLNNPETAIYRKGALLAGLAEQREQLADGAVPVLVEGPLDMLAVTATNTGRPRFAGLASCGSALTSDQVQALVRHLPDRTPITLAYDADEAGMAAAERALELLRRHAPGHPVHAALLPAGTDPAQYSQTHGAAALHHALTTTRPMVDVLIDRRIDAMLTHARAQGRGLDTGLRIQATHAIAPMVVTYGLDHPGQLIQHVAQRLDLGVEAFNRAVIDAVSPTLAALHAAEKPRTQPRLPDPAPTPAPRDGMPPPWQRRAFGGLTDAELRARYRATTTEATRLHQRVAHRPDPGVAARAGTLERRANAMRGEIAIRRALSPDERARQEQERLTTRATATRNRRPPAEASLAPGASLFRDTAIKPSPRSTQRG